MKFVCLILVFCIASSSVQCISLPPIPLDHYYAFWSAVEFQDQLCSNMYYWSSPGAGTPTNDDLGGLEIGARACLFLFEATKGLVPRYAESLRWYFQAIDAAATTQVQRTCVMFTNAGQLSKLVSSFVKPFDLSTVPLPVSQKEVTESWVDNVCHTFFVSVAAYVETVGQPEHTNLRLPYAKHTQCNYMIDVAIADFQPLTGRQVYVSNTIEAMKRSVTYAIFNSDFKLRDSLDSLLCARQVLLIDREENVQTPEFSILQQLAEQNSIPVIREHAQVNPYDGLAKKAAAAAAAAAAS
jgi:hypothetical protein